MSHPHIASQPILTVKDSKNSSPRFLRPMAGLPANKIDRSLDGPSMLRQFQDDCQALRNFQDTEYAPFATRFAQPSEKTRLQENGGEARVNYQFRGMRNFGAVNLVHGRDEEVRAAE